MPGVRGPRLRIPLQRPHVRGLQGLLSAQHHQERRLSVQVRQQLRDRHVHEAQVSGVQAEEVPPRWHAARVRRARVPVRRQAQGEEGPEGTYPPCGCCVEGDAGSVEKKKKNNDLVPCFSLDDKECCKHFLHFYNIL